MPYITKERAKQLTYVDDGGTDCNCIERISSEIKTSGELNYVITCLLAARLKKLGKNYENLKSVYGDAICAAEEFRRRMIDTYEDEKISDPKNADPYEDL